jgi:hypothetical protein
MTDQRKRCEMANENGFPVTLIDMVNEERNFSSLKSLFDFLQNEYDYWNTVLANFKNNIVVIEAIRNYFGQIIPLISTYYQNEKAWNEDEKNRQKENIIAKAIINVTNVVFSNTPIANALLEVAEMGNSQAKAFWDYLIPGDNGIISGHAKSVYEGSFRAYEFRRQGEGELFRRRESEKRALSDMRKKLADKNDQLITEVEIFQKNINEWKEKTETELIEDHKHYKAEHNKFLTEAAIKLDEKYSADDNRRQEFFDKANKELITLKSLYEEQLMLKPAAQYWKTRAQRLRKAGLSWGFILCVVTVGSGYEFSKLFEQWLSSGQVSIERFSAQHWQGIVLLGAVLSLAAFLIRTFAKLTFSAFHLQRDAEEREQLTYLYLALSEGKDVDNDSRKVVLQSLFSRADSGLLVGEHGPTMPTITEALKTVSPGK